MRVLGWYGRYGGQHRPHYKSGSNTTIIVFRKRVTNPITSPSSRLVVESLQAVPFSLVVGLYLLDESVFADLGRGDVSPHAGPGKWRYSAISATLAQVQGSSGALQLKGKIDLESFRDRVQVADRPFRQRNTVSDTVPIGAGFGLAGDQYLFDSLGLGERF